MMAGVIAPIIALRDASGSEGLGMWNGVTGSWQITKGDLDQPIEWHAAEQADLAAPAEQWPFPNIPEPDGWRGPNAQPALSGGGN